MAEPRLAAPSRSACEVYIHVYTFRVPTRAKLFKNGGSQAVRLPRSCRFPEDQTEVVVRREGRRVILEPVDEWPAAFRRCLGAWPGAIERPEGTALPELADPFA